MAGNQTTTGMVVRTGVKAGIVGNWITNNHSKAQAGVAGRTGVLAGKSLNHSKTVVD